MLLLTPKVRRDLQKIVNDHLGVVGAVVFGESTVTPEVWQLAKSMGLTDKAGIAGLLHLYGAYMATVGDPATKTTLEQLRHMLRMGTLPQSPTEARSAAYVAAKGAAAMTNVSYRHAGAASAAADDVDQRSYNDLRSAVRDVLSAKFGDTDAQERVTEAGIEDGLSKDFFDQTFRETVREAASDIGHLTGEWRRDLQRIVQTETTAAVQKGQEARWQAQEEEAAEDQERPIREVLVYKIPRPGHCNHCARLHLDGDLPRIYKLSLVQGNSNVHKKAADWQFAPGPVHPWCGCSMHKVPSFVRMSPGWVHGEADGSVIGSDGRLVTP